MTEEPHKPVSLGAFLRAKREEVGMSQSEAATALGYNSRDFLSRIENDRVPVPLNKISEIAILYKIDLSHLSEFIIEEQSRLLRIKIEEAVNASTADKTKLG
ncbi:HipB Predicted transcriptional regulators [uncultured Caudovirales phage]|uniref:HipB Predicted transcriptional regulators n=1 Tax=uncultured Caudovirales phage TaxID=2100421 RepID=A0A6J7WT76_9CAUD|nr:HipB Predicted transcriptional regulators [uncultured Caudovirales phage]